MNLSRSIVLGQMSPVEPDEPEAAAEDGYKGRLPRPLVVVMEVAAAQPCITIGADG
jgi:hypothetical protein